MSISATSPTTTCPVSVKNNTNVGEEEFKYIKFSPYRKQNPIKKSVYPKPKTKSTPSPLVTNGTFEIGVCNNCGIQGHRIKDCNEPIHSYGLIILDETKSNVLLVQRKDSYGYITLVNNEGIRSSDKEYVSGVCKSVTKSEKFKILNWDFESLWNDVVNDPKTRKNKDKILQSSTRFEKLNIKAIMSTIDESLLSSETEWGFPKGRIKKHEQWIDCAKREACEETNITIDDVKILCDVPFIENRQGTDGKTYVNVYYLSMINESGKKRWLSSAKKSNNEVHQSKFVPIVELETLMVDKIKLISQIKRFIV